jgi:hypothetical protein
MAQVTLDRLWLSDAADPADAVAFFTTGRSDSRDTAGDVRVYANGRLRVVTTGARQQTLGVTLRLVDPVALARLEGWRGRVLLLRDAWGRKLYGTYFRLTVDDYKDRSGHDVQLTFQQVSHSEAV